MEKKVVIKRCLQRDINVMDQCPQIISYIGVTWSRPIDLSCVIEYMDLGDLFFHLKNTSPTTLVYIHSWKINHRQISSSGVLLDSKNGEKLSNFATIRLRINNDTMLKGIGKYPWMAPEAITSGSYVEKCDIYSFGTLLSEFCTHKIPFSDLKDENGDRLSSHLIMTKVVEGSLLLSFSRTNAPKWVVNLNYKCLQTNPSSRPKALESKIIEKQLNQITSTSHILETQQNDSVIEKYPSVTIDIEINSKESLIQNIIEGSASAISAQLRNGADPNIRNDMDDTLLHLAVQANQGNIVDLLLRTPGVSLHERNKFVPSSNIEIDLENRLGFGGYGAVHTGMYLGNLVAIKTAHIGKQDELIKEISTMMQCRSPYIIEIVAVSGFITRKPKLVLEYMDCGDLRKYLDAKRDGNPIDMNFSTFEVVWVVANALADLSYNGIVHRNLKSQNILFSTSKYIQVGDLGISREYEQGMLTTKAGTPLWTAPEVLRSGGNYYYAADIYSFGVILSEFDTLQLPYAEYGKA
ncbi:kinase [Thraustotheca clavata]|uniref:Kinase n=1 Tax=Thraustotheca clavata TaxID=74557 RepID=A0A1W0A5F1_9STRA|nr:kinase [Thraustotheca clavata]